MNQDAAPSAGHAIDEVSVAPRWLSILPESADR
jgi:hypothetical protein